MLKADSLDSTELFLRSWWSKTYNRPLKDPLLNSYNVYELLYEFFDKHEREKQRERRLEEETDKIEDDKRQKALDWADEQERAEMESAANNNNSQQRTDDQEEWMVQELKKQYGDNFGDDVNIDF